MPIDTNGLGKSKTDGITRLHAALFSARASPTIPNRGICRLCKTSRSLHPATPSCASDSSNCIHHWILWLYFAALCVFSRNCHCIFIKCWCEFFRYISRCHFACRTQWIGVCDGDKTKRISEISLVLQFDVISTELRPRNRGSFHSGGKRFFCFVEYLWYFSGRNWWLTRSRVTWKDNI